jgi:isopentenyl diphosphate isomerase/L-lactate dehydrogenase-like FMN-dependent dehydrogenase
MEPMNVSDDEALARASMEHATWDFYAGGSDDEITLRANHTAFERLRLRPRTLVDVNSRLEHARTIPQPLRSPRRALP